MTRQTADTSPLVCAVADQTYPGETSCGDRHVIATWDSGVLLAVADGLGHGEEAARAAAIAMATVAAQPQLPLDILFGRCHTALAGTRGAALTIATVSHTGQLNWLGVGNVEGVLVRADVDRPREHVMLRGGIVGFGQLPGLYVSTVQLQPGDVLVLASDGVRGGFSEAIDPATPPDILAQRLHAEFARGTDDSLVLVARFRGGA